MLPHRIQREDVRRALRWIRPHAENIPFRQW